MTSLKSILSSPFFFKKKEPSPDLKLNLTATQIFNWPWSLLRINLFVIVKNKVGASFWRLFHPNKFIRIISSTKCYHWLRICHSFVWTKWFVHPELTIPSPVPVITRHVIHDSYPTCVINHEKIVVNQISIYLQEN